MKKIEVIVKPFKLEDIKEALADLGIDGMTVSQVSGLSRQNAHMEIYRGNEYRSDFLAKIKVEIVVKDHMEGAAVSAIVKAVRTSKAGDGKVFVGNVEEAIRVRTGERGENAL